ncbi:MAG: hypothetical protein IIB14_04270 [Chloroflexi bacterium]|nr:hypothetical protein [Chloroflexota bacterium]
MTSIADRLDGLYQRTLPRMAHRLRRAAAGTARGIADPGSPGMAAFLGRVSAHDFASFSDLELRERIARLKGLSPTGSDSGLMSEVFAIVNEAVERRLGAWRLFESEEAPDGFGKYRKLTDADLNATERALVKGMACVAKRGRVDCWSDILLDADFYQAVSEIDIEGLLRFVPTDEQLIAGHLLYQGNVVEMDSGEGKTVAAAFPAALHAICGSAVHIMTSNDYLAVRDAELLAPVYESLGLTVGFVVGYMSEDERRHAYGQSIVYGTLREFGFDYLRDNLRLPSDEKVQGPLDVVIVDEADHALIDQAGTPLIISGEPAGNTRGLKKALTAIESLVAHQREQVRELEAELRDKVIDSKDSQRLVARLLLADPENERLGEMFAALPKAYGRALTLIDDEAHEPDSRLTAGLLYLVDPRAESVSLTQEGHHYLEDRLGPVFDTSRPERELAAVESRRDIGAKERRRLIAGLKRRVARQYGRMNQLHQMLKAFVLVKRDVDYIVDDGNVVLIDELTGRTLPDNIYNRGLHAAIQAKERVPIEPERETLAQISVRGLVEQYSMVAGMTGTALDAGDEFKSDYGLTVARVPSTRPRVRTDFGTRVYQTNDDKLAAIVDEIRHCRRVGRPVLAGTLTIEQSRRLRDMLIDAGIPHDLLNAANDAAEARIVRNAGTFGAVTLATNMAGRGTDIVLEPGLNDRIVEAYVVLVKDLLNDGLGHVRLDCSSDAECSLLATAFSRSGYFAACGARDVGIEGTTLTVSMNAGEMRTPGTSVEFGLGLHVIGTELNQSSRIDRQLLGRSGRQGAPGTTRFIVSMEDQLLAYRRGEASYLGDAAKTDAAGRTYFEGRGVQRHVLKVQSSLSQDEAAERDMSNEYLRIQEAQTFVYYEARRAVFDVESFKGICEDHVRSLAHRLVGELFPDLGVVNYERQFGRLSEELWTEFGVDCNHLEGLSAVHLADAVGDLMLDGLKEAREHIGEDRLDALERQLYLQTSDEHWRGHIGNMQELMLSVSFAWQGRKHAAAEYAFRSYEAFESLREDVIEDFLRRLFRFPVDDLVRPTEQTRTLENEVAGILA